MQCDAVCYNVLQSIAVCVSLTGHRGRQARSHHLHTRGAVCCSVFQCVAVCRSASQCVAVCCSMMQCVSGCCSVRVTHRTPRSTGPKSSQYGSYISWKSVEKKKVSRCSMMAILVSVSSVIRHVVCGYCGYDMFVCWDVLCVGIGCVACRAAPYGHSRLCFVCYTSCSLWLLWWRYVCVLGYVVLRVALLHDGLSRLCFVCDTLIYVNRYVCMFVVSCVYPCVCF